MSYALAAIAFVMAAYFGFFVGCVAPRAGYALSCVSLIAVVALWASMLLGEPDGPGGALGFAMVGAASFFLLAAGVGLLSGAMGSLRPLSGLGLGLVIVVVIYLWLIPSAPRVLGAAIFIFCIAGACLIRAGRNVAQWK